MQNRDDLISHTQWIVCHFYATVEVEKRQGEEGMLFLPMFAPLDSNSLKEKLDILEWFKIFSNL